MKYAKMLKSREYREARRKVLSWKSRLPAATRDEALAVLGEKARFFSRMRDESPDLYEILRINDKELSELVNERLLGRKIVID